VVEDRGPGIAPADRKRIFEPFVRLSRTATTAGSGLGLAIVHDIVRAHRGRIWAESDVGAGTRFVIELPRT
jgi:signal transduction histidine kinase